MKNSGARSSIIVGLGAVALMLTSIACGSSNGSPTGEGGAGGGGKASGGAGGGGAKAAVLSYTFETAGATQGFQIQKYVDSTGLNLGALAADAGVPDSGTYPTLMQMDGVGQGNPPSGALAITADFSNYLQYVEITLALLLCVVLVATLGKWIPLPLPILQIVAGGALAFAVSLVVGIAAIAWIVRVTRS